MRTEVPTFKRCCFCVPLRYGLLLWGYLKLIPTTLLIVGDCFAMSVFMRFSQMYPGFAIRFSISFLIKLSNFLFTFLLIIAAHKKSIKLLRIFYYCEIVSAALNFVLALSNVIIDILDVNIWSANQKYPHIWEYMLLEALIELIHVGLQLYIIAMVRSEIIKLDNKHQFRFINNAAEAECGYYNKQEMQIFKDGEGQSLDGENTNTSSKDKVITTLS